MPRDGRLQRHDLTAGEQRTAREFYALQNLRWAHGEQVFVRSRAERGVHYAVLDIDFSPFGNVNRRAVLGVFRHGIPQYLNCSTRAKKTTKRLSAQAESVGATK